MLQFAIEHPFISLGLVALIAGAVVSAFMYFAPKIDAWWRKREEEIMHDNFGPY